MKFEKSKQIYKTSNYSEIKPHYLNRKIKSSHVKTLKEQIKYKDLGAAVPIVLNQNFQIIDGHHRFVARKDLGLPIYFVNHHGLDEKDIIMLNINRSEWTTLEAGVFYNDLYMKEGDGQYSAYNEWYSFYNNYNKNFSLSLNQGLSLLADNRHESPIDSFKEGTFYIADYDIACQIAEFMNKCFRHTQSKSGDSLGRALWFMWRLEGFNSEGFIKLLEKKTEKFKNLAILNSVAWWIKFFQDQILDYKTMTEWSKHNRTSSMWLSFFYDKYLKGLNKNKTTSPSSKKIRINLSEGF